MGLENANKKKIRTRNWTFVVYPDSAPDNWRELLDDMHIEWVESPLHDKDTNADGTPKKAHWHILVMFEGVKSFEQIQEITNLLNAPIPQVCGSAKALVRYFAHIDNPEKVQYDVNDIKAHGGVDLALMLQPTSRSRYELIGEMMDYISANDIQEYFDFVEIARTERFEDWFPLLCDSASYVIGQFIKSNRHRNRSNFDEETGEIFE